MKYVALLRGINVGGNNIIKMVDLKAAFEKAGFTGVITFIQSGNVIFNSGIQDKEKITTHIESVLSNAFHYESRVVIRSHREVKKILQEVPNEWTKENDLRCYVLFVKEPVTESDVEKEVELKEGVDTMATGVGVVYMATTMEGLTKSKFSKIIGKKIYKDVTMRNFKTTRMILEIMDAN